LINLRLPKGDAPALMALMDDGDLDRAIVELIDDNEADGTK
jgi:hypothetical protein